MFIILWLAALATLSRIVSSSMPLRAAAWIQAVTCSLRPSAAETMTRIRRHLKFLVANVVGELCSAMCCNVPNGVVSGVVCGVCAVAGVLVVARALTGAESSANFAVAPATPRIAVVGALAYRIFGGQKGVDRCASE